LAAAVEAAVAVMVREAVFIAATAASNLAQPFDKLGSASRTVAFVLGDFLSANQLTTG
jgi:CBS-domain-containing membrane protein